MKDYALELHKLFNNLPRYNHTFDPNDIPKNGIYIFFEEGEKFGELDRIVRVGTHTGNNQLCSRIKQHLLAKNKDRSIFRKNIGRAILNGQNDDYLTKWNYDLTSRKNKERYGSLIDAQRQELIEKEVTEYMQGHFTFVVFPVETKEERLELETAIIATIKSSCPPSSNWLGNHSPIEKICQSGLWLVLGLKVDPITEAQYNRLCELLGM
ncbi:MAG: hypothetical protein R3Y04_00110 [Rikenellaceae bacterium]